MAEEGKIYPKGTVKQTKDFSDRRSTEKGVYDAVLEITKEETEKAFEDAGFEVLEDYKGEYGAGQPYGHGTAEDKVNVDLNSKTLSFIQKHTTVGGKRIWADIHLDLNPRTERLDLTYSTTEGAAFRGHQDEDGGYMLNKKMSFDVSSIEDFKKEYRDLMKEIAQKEVKYVKNTKIGIEDRTEKSINSMVQESSKNNITLKEMLESDFNEFNEKVNNNLISEGEESDNDDDDTNEDDRDIIVDEKGSGEEEYKDFFKKQMKRHGIKRLKGADKSKLQDFFASLDKWLSDEEDKYLEEIDGSKKKMYKEFFTKKMNEHGLKDIKSSDKSDLKRFFSVLDDWSVDDKGRTLDEVTSAGSFAPSATGGDVESGEVGTAGNFKYPAKDFKKTPYAKYKNQEKASVKKTRNEEDTFWQTVEINPGSGYVPKGMEHPTPLGAHDVEVNSPEELARNKGETTYSREKSNKKNMNEGRDLSHKKVFNTDAEVKRRGLNKRYVPTQQLNEDEQKLRWKKLVNIEKKQTIKEAEKLIGSDYFYDIEKDDGHDFRATIKNENNRVVYTIQENEEENNLSFIMEADQVKDKSDINGLEVHLKTIGVLNNEDKLYHMDHKSKLNENCGCEYEGEDVEYVDREEAEEDNIEDYKKQNMDLEDGDEIGGEEVVVVKQPKSFSDIIYKVLKNDLMNESKMYIFDFNSGNYVKNPNFSGIIY